MALIRRSFLSSVAGLAAPLVVPDADARTRAPWQPVDLPAPDGRSFLSICWHNVEDEEPDQTYLGVTARRFVEQLGWLKANGWTAITLDQLIAAPITRSNSSPSSALNAIARRARTRCRMSPAIASAST